MSEGTLKKDDPDEVAMLLLSTCNGFFGLYISKQVSDSLTQMKAKYERMYQRILNGLIS